MPSAARPTPGGFAKHVLSRAMARRTLVRKATDFDAFARILGETMHRLPARLLG